MPIQFLDPHTNWNKNCYLV
uniref:Uncharacterized protein n=1 Tax=Arundo donax TaxID=35708 RepID=A0A0A9FEP1_ARUDO